MQNSIARNPIAEEFLREQLPLIALCFAAGIAASYWQHGALVGVAGVEFPLAGVYVPLWHLVWMGFWTGYTMALVGEASGIFSLPYSMSILRFDNIFISPTNTVCDLFEPPWRDPGIPQREAFEPGLGPVAVRWHTVRLSNRPLHPRVLTGG